MKDVIAILIDKDGKILDYRALNNSIFYPGKAFLLKKLLFGGLRRTKWYVQIGRDNQTTYDPDTELSSLSIPITEKRIYFPDEFWKPDVELDTDNASIKIHTVFTFKEPVGDIGEAGIIIEEDGSRILLNRVVFNPPVRTVEFSSLSLHFTVKFI